ncbi:hypothetical protein PV779_64960, partial [Streptomyces sp. ID01-9D]|nr:hypothetical protein [Streptomyces sp. ID01-9D]
MRRDDPGRNVHLPRLPGRGTALRMEEGRPRMGLTSRPTPAPESQQPAPPSPPPSDPVLLPQPKALGVLSRVAPKPLKCVPKWGPPNPP